LVLGPSSFAHALDPELTTPYKVEVVLRVAPNRIFTPIFKEQLRRDLKQGLQAALGAMGEVEVIDLGEVKPEEQTTLWKEVTAKGLQAGLDGPSKGTSAVKTHFVTVDYADGQYEIQARQYDGLTGLASPTVRRERTPDRQFVARTAALLVDRDFGLVGTVMGGGDGQTVRVAFKGGGLKVPLDRWVKKGDVFALVQVAGAGRTTRLPWTLLQADATPGDDGSCVCKLLAAQQRPLAAGAEFRCLKLGTARTPVRLRVTEAGRKGPGPVRVPENVVVYVRRHGFNDTTVTEGVPDSDGYYSTEKEKEGPLYDGLAFVTVTRGGQVRAQVPLELVDGRTRTLPITLGTEPPAFLTERSLWEQSLLNEQVTLGDLFPSLNKEVETRREATLDRARKALDHLSQQIHLLNQQREGLVAQAKPANGGKPLDLSKGERSLADVRAGRDQLAVWLAQWEKVQKEGTSPDARAAQADFVQAHNLELDGDYGRAIELYNKVQAKTKDAKLEQRLLRLNAAWEVKNDKHRAARAFVYETWPKLESPATMKERVKQAQEALDAFRAVKDPLGPVKLLKVALLHSNKLEQDSKRLSDTSEDDLKAAKDLDEVLGPLADLIKQATKDVAANPAP